MRRSTLPSGAMVENQELIRRQAELGVCSPVVVAEFHLVRAIEKFDNCFNLAAG